jgi:hypothetical protein
LGGELQAFDRRKEGKYHVTKLIDREPGFDRERRRLDAVGAFRREDVGAQELAARYLGDELDEAARAASARER